MWMTVEQVYELFSCVSFFKFFWRCYIKSNKLVKARSTQTNKQGNSKDLSSKGEKATMFVYLGVCFGFRGAKDMIACGR